MQQKIRSSSISDGEFSIKVDSEYQAKSKVTGDFSNPSTWLPHLELLMKQNMAEMEKLAKNFQERYRPIKNYNGILLVMDKCGKKGCTKCPHSLSWREFTYKTVVKKNKDDGSPGTDFKFLWSNTKRIKKLPLKYRHKHRNAKSLAAFMEYSYAADRLNKQRERLSMAITKCRNIFFGIIRSNDFSN